MPRDPDDRRRRWRAKALRVHDERGRQGRGSGGAAYRAHRRRQDGPSAREGDHRAGRDPRHRRGRSRGGPGAAGRVPSGRLPGGQDGRRAHRAPARRRPHRHAAREPHGAGAAGDPGRLPRLRREAVHADPRRRGGHLRRRGGAQAAGLRRASVPVRGAVAGGARVAGRDRRRRPHRELLLVPHRPPHDHAGRPGQGHPAARRLSAGRAAASRHPQRRRDHHHRPRRARQRRHLRAGASGRGDGRAPRHAQRPADRAVPEHRRHQWLVPRRLHHRRRGAAGRPGRRPRRAVHAVPPGVADADRRDARLLPADLQAQDVVPGPADDLRALLRRRSPRHAAAAVAAVDPRHGRSLRADRRGARSGRGAGRRSGARAAGRGRGADARRPIRRARSSSSPAAPACSASRSSASCVTPGSASACWRGGRRASACACPASSTSSPTWPGRSTRR